MKCCVGGNRSSTDLYADLSLKALSRFIRWGPEFEGLKTLLWDFPGGPGVKILRSHCRRQECDPLSGSSGAASLSAQLKVFSHWHQKHKKTKKQTNEKNCLKPLMRIHWFIEFRGSLPDLDHWSASPRELEFRKKRTWMSVCTRRLWIIWAVD